MTAEPGNSDRENICLVTTARHPGDALVTEARAMAHRLGARYTPRMEKSLEALRAESEGRPVIVIETNRVVCHHEGEALFFHPSMTRIRMAGGPGGRVEPLLEALDARPGDRVLDATLGRAGDAILISHAVGPQGAVIGLEASPVVAELMRTGLTSYSSSTPAIHEAMRRIDVILADHTSYLRGCESRSFDQVYFDPMFDVPLKGAQAIDPLRPLACGAPLSPEALQEALRVARRRVVVKSRRGSDALTELGFTSFSGGRWSRLVYGIMEL